MMNSIDLTTIEPDEEDVESFRIRMTRLAMEKLAVKAGDFISIAGQRTTVAIVQEAKERMDEHSIAINSRILENAGVFEKGVVEVSKAYMKPATSVKLSPIGFSVRITARFHEYIIRELLDSPLTEDDQITVSILARSHPFKVTHTTPEGAVIVTKETDLTIDQPIRETHESEFIEFNDPPYIFIEVAKSMFALTRLRNYIKTGRIEDWLKRMMESIENEMYG